MIMMQILLSQLIDVGNDHDIEITVRNFRITTSANLIHVLHDRQD